MIKAKKKFGQNFLKDDSIKYKIIKAISNDKNKIVEIGAGLGDLTVHLLRLGDVVAFEIDEELCSYISDKFKLEIETGRLKLICGDVLDFWKSQSLLDFDYKLIANLPYYVATIIILNGLDDERCKNMIVMIQKEVANKFIAESGSSEFCSLSVIAQSVCQVEYITDVPPTSFEPQPKVQSAVLSFDKNNPSYKLDKKFYNFLDVAFSQPRQTLIKNLSRQFSRENIIKIFDDLKLNLSIRPHQLNIEDYHQIYKKIKEA